MKTHYEVLGVTASFDADELKRARKERAQELHPDRAQGSHEGMAAVNAAYTVLSDPAQVKRYRAELRATHIACSKCKATGETFKQRGATRERYFCTDCNGVGLRPKGNQ